MATTIPGIPCGNCIFYNNFDSANLARVESINSVNKFEGNISFFTNSF